MTTVKCPHCDRTLESVQYSRDIREYGTMYWSDTAENADDICETAEYDCGDSDGGDEEWECPHCNSHVTCNSLVFVDDEETEDETVSHKVERPIEMDDTCLNGNTGIRQNFVVNYLEDEQVLDSEASVTCPKCKHIFEVDRNENLEECPNCNAKLKKETKGKNVDFAWQPIAQPEFIRQAYRYDPDTAYDAVRENQLEQEAIERQLEADLDNDGEDSDSEQEEEDND